MTDDELIEKMMTAKNGKKFTGLWEGTCDKASDPVYEYTAHLSLCRMLALYTNNDAERMESLFKKSPLWGMNNKRDKERLLKDTIRKAIESENLPESDRDLPEWQAVFKLVRYLRNLADDNPRQFEDIVRDYCVRSDRKFGVIWDAFRTMWKKVRKADGEDGLTWASKQPLIEVEDMTSDVYVRVASMAYHLSTLTGKDPFYLPRKQVADLLDTYPNAITNAVELLVDDGLLECVDSDWSYTKRKAKEYVFHGKLVL